MAPQRAAGRLEYYEIAISERDANNTLISQHVSYIGSQQNHSCEMITPVCTPLHRFHYQVRAVNAEQLQSEEQGPLVEQLLSMSSSLSQTQQCVAQFPLNDSAWSQIQAYQNPALYRLHKSGWSTHEVSCSPETNHAKILWLLFQIIIFLVIFSVSIILGYRKIRKMSDIDLVLPQGIMETLKKPIDNSSMSTDSTSGGGPGIASGGICTRVDTAPQYLPQYSPQDAPHDFNSGSESSKLLLANSSSSGGVYDDHLHHQPPMSYMTMKLFDDETPTTAPGKGAELNVSHSPLNNANGVGGGGGAGGGNNTGYIKPTQMKNWTAANTLDNSPAMPLSGYVPVQVLQARKTPTTAVAGLGTVAMTTPQPPSVTPMHLLSSSNYVQASDLHKLPPLAATFSTPPVATTANLPLANSFGYTAMEQLQRNGLMKPVAPSTAATTHTGQTAPGGQQNQQLHRIQPQHIGGYVTPQDLNALAHNRHMM